MKKSYLSVELRSSSASSIRSLEERTSRSVGLEKDSSSGRALAHWAQERSVSVELSNAIGYRWSGLWGVDLTVGGAWCVYGISNDGRGEEARPEVLKQYLVL